MPMLPYFRARIVVSLGGTLSALALGTAACLADLSPVRERSTDAGVSACGDEFIDTKANEECDPGTLALEGCSATCAVECIGGFIDPLTKHCYFEPGPRLEFRDALNACTARAAHVVTFGSDREADFVRTKFPSEHWVGLIERAGSFVPESPSESGFPVPGATGPCTGCFGRGVSDGGIPFSGASDGGATLDCVQTRPTGSDTPWVRVSCTNPIPVLCEREPPGRRIESCSGGFCLTVASTAGKKRYLYVPARETSEAAATACRELGGSLLVVSTREEREELAREIILSFRGQVTSAEVWVGLRQVEGQWMWDDGSLFSANPDPWGDKQPKGTQPAEMRILPGSYDSTLFASNPPEAPDGGTKQPLAFPYICQLPP